MPKLTYKSSGVNYDVMDRLKRMAQTAASATEANIVGSGFFFNSSSRGESASVVDQGNSYLAFVQEGLGTKNLVADAMFKITGKTYYDAIAQDTVAMIINDLLTVGARPLEVLAYWAAGSEEWFNNEHRMTDLTNGWRKACDASGAVWAGGETSTLSGIIYKDTIDLAGAAFGKIDKTNLVDGSKLVSDDAIVLLESSGIHANGVSLARRLAESLPDGYKTKLPSGRMYGEVLLDPTVIYAKLIQDLFVKGIEIHYMANITGHGWRKLMRNKKEFSYRIKKIPPVPEVLQFIRQEAGLDNKEAYGTFNMGAGFAVFVPRADVERVLDTADKMSINAYHVGIVQDGRKQVIIEPLNITYPADSLGVR